MLRVAGEWVFASPTCKFDFHAKKVKEKWRTKGSEVFLNFDCRTSAPVVAEVPSIRGCELKP